MGESNEPSYSDGSITVDGDYVRIGQRSYLVSEITGLEVTTSAPHNVLWACPWIGLGLFALYSNTKHRLDLSGIIFGLVLIGVGYWQWQRSKARLHNLTIFTQAHPDLALSSADSARVSSLRSAIEQARAHRG